jgi:hypothetical protein
MNKSDLRVDWATHDAARFACTNWHYSRSVPSGKLVKVGVWERGAFIGVVLFGRGANNRMAGAYGLKQDEACELVRIALKKHESSVSRVVALAFRFLRSNSPGLRLSVSYADPAQGHHGGVYQAGNWVYSGKSTPQRELVVNGVPMHKRSANAKYGTASPEKISKMTGAAVSFGPVEWKHIYLMPLDAAMRESIMHLSKPYPKRVKQATTDDQSAGRRGGTDPHAPQEAGNGRS